MTDKDLLKMFSQTRYYSSCYTRELEKEPIRIPKFDYREAFVIGTLARNFANEWFPGKPVIIDISLRNGHCLFRITTGTGSMPDDDNWIKRNRETAMRFGCSSFISGRKFQNRLILREISYASLGPRMHRFLDGGALPIFIDSCEFPVACLAISGLEQYKNHWLAIESASAYIRKINDLAGN